MSEVKDTDRAVIAEAMTSFVQAVAARGTVIGTAAAQPLGAPWKTVNSTGATRICKTVG